MSSEFPIRSYTDWAVQPLNKAKGLKFRISKVNATYYLFGENKGADQLICNPAADLRLCCRIFKRTTRFVTRTSLKKVAYWNSCRVEIGNPPEKEEG